LDSRPWEWPKTLEKSHAETKDVPSKPAGDVTLAKEAASHTDGRMVDGIQRARAASEKPTDEKLMELVKTNRQALEAVIHAQGESNPALQELARVLHELDTPAVAEPAFDPTDSSNVDAGQEETPNSTDGAIIRSQLRQRERSQTTGQEDE